MRKKTAVQTYTKVMANSSVNFSFLVVVLLFVLSGCHPPEGPGTNNRNDKDIKSDVPSDTLVRAGTFERIYDPSTGEDGAWYINDHCFVRGESGMWNLFGITHAEPAAPLDEDHFAHATAQRLTQQRWNKQPFALSADSSWEEEHLWAPHIVKYKGVYYMFYTAGDEDHTQYKIHLATSEDLKDWIRHTSNPMVVDGYDARDPYILRHDSTWVMYYTATSDPEGGNHIVAYRTSDDLLNWGERRIAFEHAATGTIAGPTESPTVIRRGNVYYLFVGPIGAYEGYEGENSYVGTAVYRSTNPFRWERSALVGRIESHAAEVMRNEEGDWFVSHAGWEQGGVYLAPLYWTDGLEDASASIPKMKTN